MANGKPGRPPGRTYDAELEIWLTSGTRDALQELADQQGRPRAVLLREVLVAHLRDLGKLPADLPAADRAAALAAGRASLAA